jgi:aspartokinase
MALVVQKFGGTSVADAQKIVAAARSAGLLIVIAHKAS